MLTRCRLDCRGPGQGKQAGFKYNGADLKKFYFYENTNTIQYPAHITNTLPGSSETDTLQCDSLESTQHLHIVRNSLRLSVNACFSITYADTIILFRETSMAGYLP